MTARFVPPTPNCGHVDGVTFTHVALTDVWMCALCIASIGPLYRRCATCGATPTAGTQLLQSKAGSICTTCQRNARADFRLMRSTAANS